MKILWVPVVAVTISQAPMVMMKAYVGHDENGTLTPLMKEVRTEKLGKQWHNTEAFFLGDSPRHMTEEAAIKAYEKSLTVSKIRVSLTTRRPWEEGNSNT